MTEQVSASRPRSRTHVPSHRRVLPRCMPARSHAQTCDSPAICAAATWAKMPCGTPSSVAGNHTSATTSELAEVAPAMLRGDCRSGFGIDALDALQLVGDQIGHSVVALQGAAD